MQYALDDVLYYHMPGYDNILVGSFERYNDHLSPSGSILISLRVINEGTGSNDEIPSSRSQLLVLQRKGGLQDEARTSEAFMGCETILHF